MKLDIVQGIEFCIGTPALDHRLRSFNTHHAGCGFCQRQSEISQPTEQVQYVVSGLRFKQFQCTCHHLLIEFSIDLDKIQWLKAEAQVKYFNCVFQLQVLRPQEADTIRSPWL